MTQTTTITVPNPQYFVVIGHPKGDYIPESGVIDLGRDRVVNNMVNGHVENVRKVIAVDLTDGHCWDDSHDIAVDVLNKCLHEYGEVPGWCIDFLEATLGCNYVRKCERECSDY